MSYLIVPKLVEEEDEAGDYFLRRQQFYAWILDQRQKKRRRPCPVELPPDGVPMPPTRCRVVADAGQKWFEFMFISPTPLVGNAAAGWVDIDYFCELRLEWTTDLQTWNVGKFVNAPVPVVPLPDGTFEIWARALNPQDAEIKTGALVCEGLSSNADTRNNPITSVMVAGSILALPRYPYEFPGDAGELEADLIAAGFTDSEVVATSETIWRISIPTAFYTEYSDTSRVSWPGYLVPDMSGVMNTVIDGRQFSGSFVNADGVPIFDRAFARLAITPILR